MKKRQVIWHVELAQKLRCKMWMDKASVIKMQGQNSTPSGKQVNPKQANRKEALLVVLTIQRRGDTADKAKARKAKSRPSLMMLQMLSTKDF